MSVGENMSKKTFPTNFSNKNFQQMSKKVCTSGICFGFGYYTQPTKKNTSLSSSRTLTLKFLTHYFGLGLLVFSLRIHFWLIIILLRSIFFFVLPRKLFCEACHTVPGVLHSKHYFDDIIRGGLLPNVLLQRSPALQPSVAEGMEYG